MERAAFAAVVSVALAATACRAETVPQIVGLPAEYVPGVPFSFELRAPGLPDFAGFTIPIVLEATLPDPDLTASAVAGGVEYPFPSTAGFTATPTPPSPGDTAFTLTIEDSGSLTFTTPDTRDLLAVVTVTPGAGLTGPIQVSLGVDTILLYNMEGRDDQLPGSVFVEQGEAPPPDPTLVPAPPAALLGVVGVALLVFRRSRRTAGGAVRDALVPGDWR